MSWFPGWDSIAWTSWWSGFFFWASIGSLMLLGASEVVSHRYTERKDELVEIQQIAEKNAHDDEIARLHLETAQIAERSALLEREAAKANERAAQLEKEAAQARLELMEIQSPRMIRPDKLAEGLAGKPTAKVEIWYVSECSDCHWLATWLAGGLLGAAWRIDQGKALPIPPSKEGPLDGSGAPAASKGGQPWGVSVLPSDGSNPAAEALREVLLNEWKKLGGGKAHDLPDGVVRITVAPRP
jgi:hypothetical protein